MEGRLRTIKSEGERFKHEVRQQTVGYIMAGLGFVAGLAWNDAIRSLIEYLFPLSQNSILAKFIYAFIVTVVVVMATVYAVRFLQDKQ